MADLALFIAGEFFLLGMGIAGGWVLHGLHARMRDGLKGSSDE